MRSQRLQQPHQRRRALAALALAGALAAALPGCGAPRTGGRVDRCAAVTCGAHAACVDDGGSGSCTCDPGYQGPATACVASAGPALGGCRIFPADHLFNTSIATLPPHPDSAAFMATLGDHPLRLDLGQVTDPASASYYGIPYNLVRGDLLGWSPVQYGSGGSPDESDCATAGATDAVVSPCLTTSPVLPVPVPALVEGGTGGQPGDHHLLLLDTKACRLWELYHATPGPSGSWTVLSSATWNLDSNGLRTAGWTSADAAGLPILPLLLKQAEAASGAIHHALRVTVPTNLIRTSYTWPARHRTTNGTASTALPEMGQLFRLKATFAIPAGATTQARAILQALKDYGMYLADGGSTWFVQGEPSAGWDDAILATGLGVRTADLEAVDLSSLRARLGWSKDSAQVPPP